MSPCSRCEGLPSLPPETGKLFVAPPLAHTRSSLNRVLQRCEISSEAVSGGVLAVALAPGVLTRLCDEIPAALSATEMADSRTLVVSEGVNPSIEELMQMQPLSQLVATVRGKWLVDILRNGRLTTHFQPIVSAADPESVFAYECLLRGLDLDGSTVNPGVMFEVATSAGLLFNLDRAARITAIQAAAEHSISSNVFINFNPTSIYDPTYCLQSTMRAFEKTGLKPEQLVFEITESEQVNDVGRLLEIVNFYRDAGFRIALDDLGAGYSSLNLLTELKPDFIKLDAGLVRNVGDDSYRSRIAAKLLELAGNLEVGTVAEGVETREEWLWLRDHGADYIQGYFFARPDSPPPLPSLPAA